MTTEAPKTYAVDCEMVNVGISRRTIALAQVVVIDDQGQVVYQSYCKPDGLVTAYNTSVSGITPEHLESAPPLSEVRARVAAILSPPGTLLVAHASWNDLAALNLAHPYSCVRDTTLYYPFRDKVGINRKKTGASGPGLARLVKEFLPDRSFRVAAAPGTEVAHDPAEDARATLELYLLVRDEWEKALARGDDCSEGIPASYLKHYR